MLWMVQQPLSLYGESGVSMWAGYATGELLRNRYKRYRWLSEPRRMLRHSIFMSKVDM